MNFRDRPDGTLVTKAPKVRLFMPHLMPRRSEALVFFEHTIEVDGLKAYLEAWNADGSRPKLSLFHIFVATAVRTLHERPRINRFIAGRRLYQRNQVEVAASVLKAKNDNAKLTVVKQAFEGTEGLVAIQAKVQALVSDGRGAKKTASEKEVSLVGRLPRWMIPLLFKLQRAAEYFNVLPRGMIVNDPLYASVMISHLGSIGIDSAFHHLYEHGTLPIFAVLGKIKPEVVVGPNREPVVRDCMTARYTFDERVADGYYAARALDLWESFLQQPWLLERPEDNGPGVPPGFEPVLGDLEEI